MDRFFISEQPATLRTLKPWQSGLRALANRGAARSAVRAACVALLAGAGLAQAGAAPPLGLIVQLKAGVVPLSEVVAPVVMVETSQAQRERAQQVWERNHQAQATYLDKVATQAGVTLNAVRSAGSALRVDLPAGTTAAGLEAAAQRLREHPAVEAVFPNERLRPLDAVTPNDTYFARQWYLLAPSAYPGAANVSQAWGRTTGATSPVVVAVVDSGVRYDHPELSGKLLAGYDFVSELDIANDGDGRDADASDPGDWVTAAEAKTLIFSGCEVSDSAWHGTAIAGIIAATANNSAGVAGVNWGAKVLPVRVAGKCGAVLSDLLDGVRWAAGLPVTGVPSNPNPAKIINLSYGGSGACNTAYQATVDAVNAAGALLFVAAGNSATPVARPADCNGVVAVTAVRGDGAKTSYGSYGAKVALAASGGSATSGNDGGLLSTLNEGTQGPTQSGYAFVAGTSFSAPLAAGVASLMLGMEPAISLSTLKSVLLGAVRPHASVAGLNACNAGASSQGVCNCTTSACGAGLLDADLALAAMQARQSGGSSGGSSSPGTETTSGGGGSMGWFWGAALWLWLAGVARARRKAV